MPGSKFGLSSTGQDRKIGSKANMDINLNSSKLLLLLLFFNKYLSM